MIRSRIDHDATIMKHNSVSLRLGRGRAELRVPASADVLQPPPVPPLADPDAAICAALDAPIGCPPLEQLIAARRPQSVAISISDITRPVPNEVILRSILDRCNRQGITDDQIVILIATGMHRPSTPAEREQLLGAALVRRCALVDHHAADAASVRAVSHDPPVRINQRFLDTIRQTDRVVKDQWQLQLQIRVLTDRKSTRLNSSHTDISRMPVSA